jgi:hypothetical protein
MCGEGQPSSEVTTRVRAQAREPGRLRLGSCPFLDEVPDSGPGPAVPPARQGREDLREPAVHRHPLKNRPAPLAGPGTAEGKDDLWRKFMKCLARVDLRSSAGGGAQDAFSRLQSEQGRKSPSCPAGAGDHSRRLLSSRTMRRRTAMMPGPAMAFPNGSWLIHRDVERRQMNRAA